MRKVIGIGETIYDIIFKNNQPLKAVPGGSTFNCMVSLGRLNIPALFVSETGDDKIGNMIKEFMKDNNLSTEFIDFFRDGSSPIALAFLDEKHDAEYMFYRNFPKKRLDIDLPTIQTDDILVFGSYFALNPLLRDKVSSILLSACDKAIIYYDINFRKAHAYERNKLMASFLENFENSTIIRCSEEDLETLYPGESIESVYHNRISFYCKNFIVTKGSKGVYLKTATIEKSYSVEPLEPVSTIGAGDNFNAGIIYGLMKYGYSRDDINHLKEKDWDKLISLGIQFSSEVCMSTDNYISGDSIISL
ncbi:MAG: carbohydrate kinase [Dysgonamonadaceae bacterium]|jgi:fructokinase|nr:carbohydrate kinase [Dysgonamonadaceae bacterium]